MAHRGAPPAAASEPLETSEQESVIAELRAQGRAHERFARRAFAGVHALAFCSVAFCAGSLLARLCRSCSPHKALPASGRRARQLDERVDGEPHRAHERILDHG